MKKRISREELRKYLKEYFGFEKFKKMQEDIILSLLEGNDVFVLMPTGGGKSLTYQLPALISDGTAVIISPLIALMKNQVDAMRAFRSEDGIAHFINSQLSRKQLQQVKDDIVKGKTKLLYVAPESLTKEENIKFLRSVEISFYAIDEAHCISEWGHDFRPEYRRIRPIINEIKRRPIIALTATATPKVQHDILKNLNILDAKIFKTSFFRPNLYYEVRPKKSPEKQIIQYIKNNKGKSGIIYCLSRKKVEELATLLKTNGIKALPYHAGLDAATRTKHQDAFLNEEVDVIVATIAFGMGIDKPDIRFVFHYDMPKSLEAYYQETGRAGRDGGEGVCIAFYDPSDIEKLEKFLQGKPISEQEIGKQLIQEVVAYAESAVCRPKMLLNYFGEELAEPCGNCDNCIRPRPQFDGTEDLIKILKTIVAVQEKFKPNHIAKIIAGKSDSSIKTYKHDKLKVFGIGKDKPPKYWESLIRQAMVHGLLTKDIENYGTVKLTEKGKKFLKNPWTIKLVEPHNFEKEEQNTDSDSEELMSRIGIGTADQELFSLLKDLRKRIAKREKLAPYMVFEDPVLQDMSIYYPITEKELLQISGVNAIKAKKFGKEFVDLIKEYVEEKEIIRPQDIVVKVPAKSGIKVSIIKNIDRKMDFEDICEALQIEPEELYQEIEAILRSGTRLDFQYYVDKMIDDDRQADLNAYFEEEGLVDIDQAIEELVEDDYEEDEIKLMRLKYMSDLLRQGKLKK